MGEPTRRDRSDPRTEWIADGCASWITDMVIAIPVLVVAVVIVAITGAPWWSAVAAAGLAAWAVGGVRRMRRGDRGAPRGPHHDI